MKIEIIAGAENGPVAEFFSSSNTPETDAEHAQFAMGGFTLDFCRKLERERDEAREALRDIAVADWKTSGELRCMARRALEGVK